jgi:hypothetical protein
VHVVLQFLGFLPLCIGKRKNGSKVNEIHLETFEGCSESEQGR